MRRAEYLGQVGARHHALHDARANAAAFIWAGASARDFQRQKRRWRVVAYGGSACGVVGTLQANPMGAMVLVLLASCAVAAGWAWR